MEIPDKKEGAKMPEYRIRVAPNTVAYADRLRIEVPFKDPMEGAVKIAICRQVARKAKTIEAKNP